MGRLRTAAAAGTAGTKVTALEHHALEEIETWRETDDAIVASLGPALVGEMPAGSALKPGTYAADAVAAAVTLAFRGEGKPAADLLAC